MYGTNVLMCIHENSLRHVYNIILRLGSMFIQMYFHLFQFVSNLKIFSFFVQKL